MATKGVVAKSKLSKEQQTLSKGQQTLTSHGFSAYKKDVFSLTGSPHPYQFLYIFVALLLLTLSVFIIIKYIYIYIYIYICVALLPIKALVIYSPIRIRAPFTSFLESPYLSLLSSHFSLYSLVHVHD